MKVNKRWVTLIEMIIYMWIFIIAVLIMFAVVVSMLKVNNNTNLSIKLASNITNSQIYLDKALENINNVLLVYHKDTNTFLSKNILWTDLTQDTKYFNQHEFTLSELSTQCDFIINDEYDLIAFTSRNSLDPIVVGVIEKESETWRKYRQLAIYSYRSLQNIEQIRWDVLNWNISDFIDNNWRYISEGLTPWKCDINNGFLIPISSKYFIDEESVPENYVNLKYFKVVVEDLSNIIKYWHSLVEFSLVFEKVEWEKGNLFFQEVSKLFKY